MRANKPSLQTIDSSTDNAPNAAVADSKRQKPVALLLIIGAVTLIGFYGQALAAGVYNASSSGYDISYPQCGKTYPAAPYAFGIVGVTGGKAFTQNPCLSSEYNWAALATNASPSLYMNLNYPIGTTASYGDTGPKGKCSPGNKPCQAYNYGYNAALNAFQYAASQSAPSSSWWLDIETSNSWSAKTDLNDQVIQGAIDFLRAHGITIGVYSTRRQWNIIAGSSFIPNVGDQSVLPNWVAGATYASVPSFCSPSYAFGGGTVWLVQYASGSFSGDYAC